MTYDIRGDGHDLGSNAENFERVNADEPSEKLTTAQSVAMFVLCAMLGVAITLMFGLAINTWMAKAAFLHANPLAGQPW